MRERIEPYLIPPKKWTDHPDMKISQEVLIQRFRKTADGSYEIMIYGDCYKRSSGGEWTNSFYPARIIPKSLKAFLAILYYNFMRKVFL